MSNYGEQVTVGPVKANFVSLGTPDVGGRFSKNKYVMTLLVPKDDTENMKIITDAIKDAGQCEKLSELEKHPLLDGEGNLRDGDAIEMAQYPHYKGCVYFSVSSKNRPPCFVIGEDGVPEEVVDKDEIDDLFYDGASYDVILQPYAWEEGKVTLFLQSVLKRADGPRFGAKIDPRQAFLKRLSGEKPKAAAKVDSEEEVEEKPKKKRGRPKKSDSKKQANGKDTDAEADSSLAKGGKKKSVESDLSAVLD